MLTIINTCVRSDTNLNLSSHGIESEKGGLVHSIKENEVASVKSGLKKTQIGLDYNKKT